MMKPVRSVTFSDETKQRSTFDVNVDVFGFDSTALRSKGKVFYVNGREYSMSRFGTWALHEIHSKDAIEHLARTGGLIVYITWGFLQICPKADVWVKNLESLDFTVCITQSKYSQLSEQIATGNAAKSLEKTLRDATPLLLRNFRVREIRILGNEKKQARLDKTTENSKVTAQPTALVDAEAISGLMGKEDFKAAFGFLKHRINGDVSNTMRLQMLLRLGVCCFRLENTNELLLTIPRIRKLLEDIEIPQKQIQLYAEDIVRFCAGLVSFKMNIAAVEVALTYHRVIKRLPDPDQKLETLLSNIMLCATVIKTAIKEKPNVSVKNEMQRLTEKLEKEIEYIRKMTGCDQLHLSRAVYYCLYVVTEIKASLEKRERPVYSIFAAMEFANVESAWADYTDVLRTVRSHPQLAPFMNSDEFMKTIKEISENPTILEKRILDEKIAKVNAILNGEFDPITEETDLLSGFDFGFNFPESRARPMDNKAKAEIEKEKGNDAYKRNQFQKALTHYDRAISLDPANALLHSNKAAVYISQNKLSAAKTSCLKAMSIARESDKHDDKDTAKILARLARVEFLSKKYDAAMALYQKCLRLNEDPKIRKLMKECEDTVLADCLGEPMSKS